MSSARHRRTSPSCEAAGRELERLGLPHADLAAERRGLRRAPGPASGTSSWRRRDGDVPARRGRVPGHPPAEISTSTRSRPCASTRRSSTSRRGRPGTGTAVDVREAACHGDDPRFRRYLAKFGLRRPGRRHLQPLRPVPQRAGPRAVRLLRPGRGQRARDRAARPRGPDAVPAGRVRRQVLTSCGRTSPSKTIVAHLAKDGNGYVHPDQNRSITRARGGSGPVVPRRLRLLRVAVRPVGPGRQRRAARARARRSPGALLPLLAEVTAMTSRHPVRVRRLPARARGC